MKKISLTATFCLSAILFAFSQGNNAQEAPSKYKADLDTQFNQGSSIANIPLDARRTNNLFIVGKVWGFVKYYHPALHTGDYNWDYELFRIMPKIIRCSNDKERNEILLTWIRQLGTFKTGNIKVPDSTLVKLYPDQTWIDDTSVLGEPLSILLNDVKNAKRNKTGYYLGIGRAGNADLTNEKAYGSPEFPDTGFRLLALYRYWNIIQYLFPYKYLIEENWNDVLREFIPKFVNASNAPDYRLAVVALIARVHDTHANIYSSQEELKKYNGNFYAPVDLTFIENKAVVKDYLNDETGPKTGLQKGDVIISVNGKSTDSIVKEKLPFTPASNYATKLRNMAGTLLRTADTVLNITYQHGHATHTTTISCYPPSMLNFSKKYNRKDTCFKYVAPGIVYIYPPTLRSDYLEKVMPEFLNSKGMIIDMRNFMRDDVFPALAKYLFPAPTRFARITTLYTPIPGLFAFETYSEIGKKNPDYYKGRIVIIVNEMTQSSSEYKSMAFRSAPRTTVVGSTTAAADGNVSRFVLPGGIRTAISGIGIYYPDGRETQRVGIVPDYTVHPTIQGIIQNRDEPLEKAIDILNEK